MIKAKEIVKKFDDYTAVDGLSLEVGDASVYGLVGYNGAGKTTFLKVLSGVYMQDSGTVELNGVDLNKHPEAKCDLVFVPDDLYFELGATLYSTAKKLMAYHPGFSYDTFIKLTTLFGLDLKKRISGFSKGMQRQAVIVLALACQPKALLLDETFDGLDPAKRNLTKKLLLDYMAEKGCSIIISSHNLHELADMCDRIALINGQKIVMDCSVDDTSGSRCRFRLAFNQEITEDAFREIKYRNYKADGKIITFTVSNDIEKAEEIIKSLSPVIMEKFPMSLEEIFLEEMEDTDYDFEQIFS